MEASTNQELNQKLPSFNLSSKVLCQVVDVRLLVLSVLNPLLFVCLFVWILRKWEESVLDWTFDL